MHRHTADADHHLSAHNFASSVDDDLITAWGLLTEAAVAVARNLSAGLDAAGHLSLAEFDVLIRLHREPAHQLPLATIAHDVGLTPPGLAKLVNRMELDDLLTTHCNRSATHEITAAITPHGTDLVTVALRHHTADLRRHLLRPIGHQGLAALTDLTRALRDTNT